MARIFTTCLMAVLFACNVTQVEQATLDVATSGSRDDAIAIAESIVSESYVGDLKRRLAMEFPRLPAGTFDRLSLRAEVTRGRDSSSGHAPVRIVVRLNHNGESQAAAIVAASARYVRESIATSVRMNKTST